MPAATLGIKLTWTGATGAAEAAVSAAAASSAEAGASSLLGDELIYQI